LGKTQRLIWGIFREYSGNSWGNTQGIIEEILGESFKE
jgi:hypothetical protein